MKLLTTKKAFTLVELMIVLVIIGTLGKISADTYFKMYDQSKYEKCIYSFQQYVQQARNLSLVNQADYIQVSDSYTAATGHGVEFKMLNNNAISFTLFQDKNNDKKFTDSSEKLLDYSEKNVFVIKSLTGTLAESTTPATAFTSFTVYFQADPDPKALITTNNNENLRNFELKLSHLRRDGTSGYQKKFFFDSITRVSEVNDFPILVDSFKKNDNTIILSANDNLQDIADISAYFSQFEITQDGNSFIPISGSIKDRTITLGFANPLPLSGNPLKIQYSSTKDILSLDNIPLEPRSLQISL